MSIISLKLQLMQSFRTGSNASGSKIFFHLEQNNMLWMIIIFRKFIFPGVPVQDCCAATFPVDKACALLPQHRQFIRCELSSKCVVSSPSQLALVLAWQILNMEVGIIEDNNVEQAALAYFNVIKKMDLKSRFDVR